MIDNNKLVNEIAHETRKEENTKVFERYILHIIGSRDLQYGNGSLPSRHSFCIFLPLTSSLFLYLKSPFDHYVLFLLPFWNDLWVIRENDVKKNIYSLDGIMNFSWGAWQCSQNVNQYLRLKSKTRVRN